MLFIVYYFELSSTLFVGKIFSENIHLGNSMEQISAFWLNIFSGLWQTLSFNEVRLVY